MARSILIPLSIVLLCANAWTQDTEAPKPADESVLQALPKVPTLATIVGDGSVKTAPGKWVQELMKKKETKARVEIVVLKQKLLAEQETQDVEERERLRRKSAYDKAHGGTLFDTQPVAEQHKRAIRMKLEFQVPEIEMYRRIVEVYKMRAALATSVVDALTKLDRNNDGKLTGDEYRDAAFIVAATQKLFLGIDNDSDGFIALAEVEAAKNIPADADAAMAAGEASRSNSKASSLIIKDFDTHKSGVLNLSERKALSSAFLEASLKAQQEADAYQKLLDELITARLATAAKFENLTIELGDLK